MITINTNTAEKPDPGRCLPCLLPHFCLPRLNEKNVWVAKS